MSATAIVVNFLLAATTFEATFTAIYSQRIRFAIWKLLDYNHHEYNDEFRNSVIH